jgi:predicted histone-like DNA-binding protein
VSQVKGEQDDREIHDSADIVATIEALLTIIPDELADGNIVSLGDFGTFSLRIRSEGADTAEEVTARNISNTLVTFRPGKRFKQVLNRITYEKA